MEKSPRKEEIIGLRINHFLDKIDNGVGWFIKLLLLFMSLLIAMQAFSRYLLGFSFSWVPEVLRFSAAWLVFVGASISVRYNEHIGFAFLRERVNKRARRSIILLGNTIIIIFLVWTVIQGIDFMIAKRGVLSSAMRISMFYPYLALPVGLTLVVIEYILTSVLVFLDIRES